MGVKVMAINVNEVKLGVIGCGKMASAILSGLVNNKFLKNHLKITIF